MAFTRPYYIEGIALLTKPGSPMQEFAALEGGGANTKVSILQNVDAEQSVHMVLPQAQVLQIDTQANVIQALEAGRVDAAAVDLSTVGVDGQARSPTSTPTAASTGTACSTAPPLRQGDPDWLDFVDTTWNVAMFGHQNAIFDQAIADFFGLKPPVREPGLPPF